MAACGNIFLPNCQPIIGVTAVRRRDPPSSPDCKIAFNKGSDAISVHRAQSAPRRQARSRSRCARPYICCLTSLSLVIWPPVWPLDQGSSIAAAIASLSAATPLPNLPIGLRSASSIHPSRSATTPWRITRWKRSMRPRARTSAGTTFSAAATKARSRATGDRVQRSTSGPELAHSALGAAQWPRHLAGAVSPTL